MIAVGSQIWIINPENQCINEILSPAEVTEITFDHYRIFKVYDTGYRGACGVKHTHAFASLSEANNALVKIIDADIKNYERLIKRAQKRKEKLQQL